MEATSSYQITEQPSVKTTEGTKVVYKKPKEQKDYDQAVTCVTRGLEEANQAISLDPENPNSWSYKANLLREMSKLAA